MIWQTLWNPVRFHGMLLTDQWPQPFSCTLGTEVLLHDQIQEEMEWS